MPVGEQYHIDGQDGVDLAKRWLESTGRFRIRWTTNGGKAAIPYLAVDQFDGDKAGFDMFGDHFDAVGQQYLEVYAEVKNYNGAHDQPARYQEFLVDCASAVMYWIDHPPVLPTQFLWITWHPFGATAKYLEHVSATAVKEACLKDWPVKGQPDETAPRLPPERVTDDFCAEVAGRLWLLIAPRRLPDMLLDQSVAA